MSLLSDFINLFKLIKGQLDKKVELDKKLLDQFVTPIWDKFTDAHEDYLKTFGSYIELAAGPNKDFNKLIEEIHTDSINSSNIRSDLFNHIEALDFSHKHTAHKYRDLHFRSFFNAIKTYFRLQEYFPYSINKTGDKVIILSDQPPQYDWDYFAQETIWKLSKENNPDHIKAIEILCAKIDSSKKTSIMVNRRERYLSTNKSDIIIDIKSNTDDDKIKKQNEKVLSEWGRKISDLTTSPNENFPRAVLITALVINNKSQSNDVEIVPMLKHMLSIIQERYHHVSKEYYNLKIELLN